MVSLRALLEHPMSSPVAGLPAKPTYSSTRLLRRPKDSNNLQSRWLMPKISVAIPNYNHAQYPPRRIESVLNQTYSNVELLVLDDMSIDGSRGGDPALPSGWPPPYTLQQGEAG
jgi:hypothetical protein